jgi:hypothetical protein
MVRRAQRDDFSRLRFRQMAGIRIKPARARILAGVAGRTRRLARRSAWYECISAQDRQADVQTQVRAGFDTVRRGGLGLAALALILPFNKGQTPANFGCACEAHWPCANT